MDETTLSLLLVQAEVVGGFLALMLVLVLLLRLRSRKHRAERRAERRRKRRASNGDGAAVSRTATESTLSAADDAPAELPRIIAHPMPVIGLIEERVYDELEDIASQSIMGHRVLTQLSLSAFLYAGSAGLSRADQQRVTAHLAGLQVDFLIVDADWQPVVAVSIERDAGSTTDALEAEAEICRQAGVAYLVVQADGMSKERLAEITRLLAPKDSIAAQ